jgi:hypothetical protein
MVAAYDVRGAWLLQPSVNLVREPFRFMLQYSAILGSFTGFDVFRDRDQVSFIFNYLMNSAQGVETFLLAREGREGEDEQGSRTDDST